MSLKCDPFLAQSLREQYPAVTSGYHLSEAHWNTVLLDSSVPEQELQWMVGHSYELIHKNLTKLEKEALTD